MGFAKTDTGPGAGACPGCGGIHSEVKDSRPCGGNSSVRRRRVCCTCDHRFTTYERTNRAELPNGWWLTDPHGHTVRLSPSWAGETVLKALHAKGCEGASAGADELVT